MDKNIIVRTIENIIGTDKIEYISGYVKDIGSLCCNLLGERGCVYGFAVQIPEKDVNTVFQYFAINKILHEQFYNEKKPKDCSEWKPIEGNYYPLYWGKDKNMGLRLAAHTKSIKSTHTLQFCNIDILKGYKVIYGAIPCLNCKSNEDMLHETFPDVLKTRCYKRKNNTSHNAEKLIDYVKSEEIFSDEGSEKKYNRGK